MEDSYRFCYPGVYFYSPLLSPSSSKCNTKDFDKRRIFASSSNMYLKDLIGMTEPTT